MRKRAAVVIGVNKTGGMVKLDSAAKEAQDVAEWLEGEGYDVECLTDQTDPVTSQQVSEAVEKFVKVPPQYDFLLVYFSGHGQWQSRSDYWLLSGAPTKTSEAVNLDGAIDLATYSGIPNIVFISDVCRTNPDSRPSAFVSGIDAFPNFGDIDKESDIDVIKATSAAQPAYEGVIDGEPHGLLTYALKSAYTSPKPDMVSDIPKDGDTIKVVPNRKLRGYLQPKVDELLIQIGSFNKQRVKANIPSDDVVYISKVLSLPISPTGPSLGDFMSGAAPPVPPMHAPSRGGDFPSSITSIPDAAGVLDTSPDIVFPSDIDNIEDDVDETLRDELSTRDYDLDQGQAGTMSARLPETNDELRARLPRGRVDHFESQTGFIVFGAVVVDAKIIDANGDPSIDVMHEFDNNEHSFLLRVWDAEPAASIFVKFEDGRSMILACLFGYIGFVTADETGISNISYVPATNNWRWHMYEQKKEKVDKLRALVSLAIDHNNFIINSEQDGESLASKIRVEKAIDPTLGLYAAHAFHQASKQEGGKEKIADVRRYMQHDLNADLFDVKLLSSRVKNQDESLMQVPICPMLTQTWNLLRSRNIKLPKVLEDAEPYLCDSLWTTFLPEATDNILEAIEKGDLL